MERPSWERVEVLLKAGLDIEDERARDAFLVAQCGSDKELLSELRRLLSESDNDNSRFLEPPSMLAFDLTGRTIDDFEIIEEIGRGSSGVVYRAIQRSLNRVVALKVLPLVLRANDATAERFRREAIAASKLRHPGIASVISFGEVDGTFYYAMEFVDGPSLRAVMDRAWGDKALPIDPQIGDPRAIARLVAEVADALHFAHEGKVVHRDVKPHNILLDRDGRPRLIDFGLAKLLDQRSISVRGDLLGTAYYMSPEQTRARQEDVDRRSDVFSLGVVMYELLARRRPFEGDSHVAIFKSIVEDETPSMRRTPVRVPGQLEKICRHALEKEPKDRFQTAHEFAVELRRFLNGEQPLFKELPIAEKLRRTLVKRRTLLVAVPVAIAIGASAMLAAQPSGPTFDVSVRTLDGSRARLVTRQLASLSGEFAGELSDHGRGSEWTVPLPLGLHRVELVGKDGSFAEWTVYPSGDPLDNTFRARMLQPVAMGEGTEGWARVPAARVGEVIHPALSEEMIGQTSSHGEFLVDRVLVSNADFRRLQSAGWKPEYPKSWNRMVEVWKSTPAETFDQLPLVATTIFEAQRIAVELGGRLPDMAECVGFTVGGRSWWDDSPQATAGLAFERPRVTDGAIGSSDYVAGAVGVRAVEPRGPFELFHPIGNVAIHALTARVDSQGFVSMAGSAYGFAWTNSRERLQAPHSEWSSAGQEDFGHIEVGIRRVRSLGPQLGARY
jgi:serine/threonine protein kinase